MFISVQQCIDCSLMRVPMSLGHKISQLLLRMRSSNKHEIMPKWGIFNVSLKFSYTWIFSGQSLKENLLSVLFQKNYLE